MHSTDCRHRTGPGDLPVKRLRRLAALAIAISAAACSSTSPDQPGTWGSDQASLTIKDSSGTLRILASGGCYGSYGEFAQRLPAGAFTFPGTFTQLIGAYPGKLQYPAQFSGSVTGAKLSLTVAVPALQQSFGPFTLTHGVSEDWPACLYP
jgi:hypothetical protein